MMVLSSSWAISFVALQDPLTIRPHRTIMVNVTVGEDYLVYIGKDHPRSNEYPFQDSLCSFRLKTNQWSADEEMELRNPFRCFP